MFAFIIGVYEADGSKREAFEVWIWRRIEKISWVDKTNTDAKLE